MRGFSFESVEGDLEVDSGAAGDGVFGFLIGQEDSRDPWVDEVCDEEKGDDLEPACIGHPGYRELASGEGSAIARTYRRRRIRRRHWMGRGFRRWGICPEPAHGYSLLRGMVVIAAQERH